MNDVSELMQRDEPLCEELAAHVRDGPLGPMIHHPLTIQIVFHPQKCALWNELLRQKTAHAKAALASGDWTAYLMLHERPYRLEALFNCLQEGLADADPREIGETVAWVWTDSENIGENASAWRAILEDEGIREAWRSVLPKRDASVLAAMPETVTIYRGFDEERDVLGFSWTTDEKKARWFAHRGSGEAPKVATATVLRERIVVYTSSRNESEVIVLPDDVVLVSIEEL